MDSKTMKCRLKESERAELLLGPVTAAARLHFDSCAPCAHASAEQARLWRALDAWSVPEVSSGFDRTLYAKIDQALAAPWYERWASAIREAFSQPALAVAAIALVAVGGFVLDHPSSVVGRAHTAVQVSSSEADQVERTLEDLEMLHQFDAGADEKENTQKSM